MKSSLSAEWAGLRQASAAMQAAADAEVDESEKLARSARRVSTDKMQAVRPPPQPAVRPAAAVVLVPPLPKEEEPKPDITSKFRQLRSAGTDPIPAGETKGK